MNAMRITTTFRQILAIGTASIALAACGGGGGGGGGGSAAPPQPSGQILFGVPGGAPITTSASNPYPVNMSSGTSSQIFTAQETNFSGNFTVTTACSTSACQQFGPSLVPTNGSAPPPGSPPNTTTFPSGGVFAFRCGLVCVEDGHVETATISDGLGHSVTEYFSVF